jgi:hypothetical protein
MWESRNLAGGHAVLRSAAWRREINGPAAALRVTSLAPGRAAGFRAKRQRLGKRRKLLFCLEAAALEGVADTLVPAPRVQSRPEASAPREAMWARRGAIANLGSRVRGSG